MEHRAQVSLFLILSVIIITLTVVMVGRQTFWNGDLTAGSNAGMVQEFIEGCLGESSKEAMYRFFLQDPTVEVVPLTVEDLPIEWWPIWYNRGRTMLSDDVVSLIEGYARESQIECTGRFRDLPFPVHENGVSFKVDLAEESVWFSLHQPVIVGGERAQTVISDMYPYKVGVRLSVILEVAQGILSRIQEDPGQIPVDFMVDQSILHGLSVTFSHLEGESGADTSRVVYRIEDIHADSTIRKPYIQFIARME